MESIAILGATGSIGKSSLDVISRYPDRFTVYAVTANSSVKKLAQAAKDSGAKVAVIADKELLGALQEELRAAGSTAEALAGSKAIDEIAANPEVDIVIGAIVGAAEFLLHLKLRKPEKSFCSPIRKVSFAAAES